MTKAVRRLAPIPLLLMLAYAALVAGTPRLSASQVYAGLFGPGADWLSTLVTQFRLPRLCAALVVGIGLGAAGALLQNLTRNRLASPDVLGINDGALLALALSLMLNPTGLLGPWWCAVAGALITAVFTLLAAGGVGTRGYRVLVVGLGIASLLRAGFDIALATLPIFHATGLYAFSVGSLAGRAWPVVTVAAALLGILLTACWVISRALALLCLHDDSIRGLGVNLGQLRFTVLMLAAALAGVTVGVGGPIGFVALAAPMLAQRLSPDGGIPVWCSASIGAVLVTGADLLGRIAAAPVEVPVGVVSGFLGGPFLLWLLVRPKACGAG
ncbi:FecCD family ABC transporter permease [Methylomonas fluvii]|uniref:Iron ABC transporter permease n=1 Tax=Methylomonas fluvii TaxID=1854564 RepID=A0ABR9DKW6_9GAMM|nr:iron ABC transporter permease [Methylomonas fluvii]MBD9362874.1 iron ABC transporter permease [Methylomonas fluvii]